MRVLLFGSRGQLGHDLESVLSGDCELMAIHRHSEKGLCGDLSDTKGLRQTLRAIKPDVVINAAAFTAVDAAEQQRTTAWQVNAEAPGVLAEECHRLGSWLIHYSTDYVFDGTGAQFWRESDPTNPLNYYGESKLAGEKAIQQSGCRYIILRTSWLFSGREKNFIDRILESARHNSVIEVPVDQVGAPTDSQWVASLTVQALQKAFADPSLAGLYHLAAAGETSRYDYARYVIDRAHACNMPLRVEEVLPVASETLSSPARRPANSRLDTTRFCSSFGVTPPDWRQAVQDAVSEYARFKKRLPAVARSSGSFDAV